MKFLRRVYVKSGFHTWKNEKIAKKTFHTHFLFSRRKKKKLVGRKKWSCLKKEKNELFCWHFMKKSENKKAHFLGFGDKGWEGGRQLCNCLQETKSELFFLQAFFTCYHFSVRLPSFNGPTQNFAKRLFNVKWYRCYTLQILLSILIRAWFLIRFAWRAAH